MNVTDKYKVIETIIVNLLDKIYIDLQNSSKRTTLLVELEYNIQDFENIVSPTIIRDILPLLNDTYYKQKPFIYSVSINKKGYIKFQIHNFKN